MLPIRRLVFHAGRMPVAQRFSYGEKTQLDFIIARVVAGDVEGLGECLNAPAEGLEGLARPLLGADATRLDGLLGVGPERYESWKQFRPNALREMLSMALYDAVGRAHGLPMHALLGGARRTVIPLMPCVFPATAAQAEEGARRFVDAGYRAIKTRLYGDLALDVAVVRAVRRAFPEGRLLGDANRGYRSPAAAREAMRALGEAGLSVAEDILRGSLDAYAELRREFGAPRVMVDARSRGWKGLRKTCKKKAAHEINIHANCQGTMSEVLARAAAAEAAGIVTAVGGVGYTGIGAFAYAHVASVVGLEQPHGEQGGAFDAGLAASSARRPLVVKDGDLFLPEGPGHGGELDLDAIGPYITDTLELS